jgi:hypothetical protein
MVVPISVSHGVASAVRPKAADASPMRPTAPAGHPSMRPTASTAGHPSMRATAATATRHSSMRPTAATATGHSSMRPTAATAVHRRRTQCRAAHGNSRCG